MRILLVGNYALDRQSSMLRYADFLRAGMVERGHQVEMIHPQPVFGNLVRRSGVRKWLGYIDKYLMFPPVLRSRSRGFDLVHICDHSNAVYLPHTKGGAVSVTCHDLLAIASAKGRFPQQKISFTGKMQQRWIRGHLARARNVVCVSHNTAREFAEQVCGDTGNVAVIPNPLSFAGGAASQQSVERLRSSLGLGEGESYLFHVGGNHWYKNRPGVLRIYRALREALRASGGIAPRLVMAGEPFSDEMREFMSRSDLQSSVIEVVQPSDDDLRTLYSGALALLFPSLYEGFGWPIIEAQSCGCPVITSDRAPMTEVGGDSVMYVDPGDETAAAAYIAAHLDRLPLLREAGELNVSRFEPGRIASQYEEFFVSAAQCRTLGVSALGDAERIEGDRDS